MVSDKDSNGAGGFPTVPIVFARFTCGFGLHMALQHQMKAGMNHIKLVLNHPYRFQNPSEPLTLGFMQTFASISIEIVNLIVILTSNTILDVVMNFMALAVIAEFAEFFYGAQSNTIMNDIIDPDNEFFNDLYVVTRTTSNRADEVRDEHLTDDPTLPIDEEGKPLEEFKYIKVHFTGIMRLIRLKYKLLRVF